MASDLLSLCIICRDEAENVKRLVTSARPHVAEIIVVDTGSVDGSAKAAKEAGADKVKKAKHLLRPDGLLKSFAEARNLSYSLATKKWQLWLDCDDDLSNWDMLDPIIVASEEQYQKKPGFNVAFWYDYSWTEDRSRCIQSYTRKRLTRASDGWKWHRPVHEYISFDGDNNDLLAVVVEPRVIHLSNGARGGINDRNLKLMEWWKDHGGEKEDPQALWYYMGDEMLVRGRYAEAEEYFKKVEYSSDNPHWYNRAAFRAARCMMMQKKVSEAMNFLMDSIKHKSQPAQHYWELARGAALLGQPQLAKVILRESYGKELIMGEDATYGDQLKKYLGM